MPTELSADTQRTSLIPRPRTLREYLWFAAVLLVMVTVRALETQAP